MDVGPQRTTYPHLYAVEAASAVVFAFMVHDDEVEGETYGEDEPLRDEVVAFSGDRTGTTPYGHALAIETVAIDEDAEGVVPVVTERIPDSS